MNTFKGKYLSKINILLVITIIVGITLRVIFLFHNRPLWNDECALALNLVHFNFFKLFKTLDFGQAAPPLFMLISELFFQVFKHSETSLRLFPMFSSILSVICFYFLAKNILHKKNTIFFAIVLFCFNFQLLYYSQEFKQYSSDILIFIIILTSSFYLKLEHLNLKKIFIVGVLYAFSVWVSFTAAIAVISVLLFIFIENAKYFKKILVMFAPILVSFIIFNLSQGHLASDNYLHSYWVAGFINKNYSNFFSIIWNFFIFGFDNLFLFLLFAVGIISSLFSIKDKKSLILLIPFVFAILLSKFSLYPLESRVSLYLIPIFILFIAKGIDCINIKNKLTNIVIYSFIVILGCLPSIISSSYSIVFKDYNYEDIVSSLQFAQNQIGKDDILYIPEGSKLSYEYYKSKFKFKNVVIENKRILDSKKYTEFLENNLQKNKTYYYVFCHYPKKKERLKDVYLWAKKKQNFKMLCDKNFNALLIFKD